MSILKRKSSLSNQYKEVPAICRVTSDDEELYRFQWTWILWKERAFKKRALPWRQMPGYERVTSSNEPESKRKLWCQLFVHGTMRCLCLHILWIVTLSSVSFDPSEQRRTFWNGVEFSYPNVPQFSTAIFIFTLTYSQIHIEPVDFSRPNLIYRPGRLGFESRQR